MRKLKPALFSVGAAFGLTVTSCAGETGASVACGEGTVLSTAGDECLPASGGMFNIVVDDFKLGQFQMSDVDVPEQLEVGTPDSRTFTITNNGTDKRDVVSVRFGIAPVKERIEELQAELAAIGETSEFDATFIGQVIIDNLEPGETRTVTYELNVPSAVTDGLYGFFFAVDEVPLVKNDDGSYSVDLTKGDLVKKENTVRLGEAALLHAPATVIVGKPDKPNLRILSAKLDNASFVLDRSEQGDEPLFTLTSRISSQALNVTEPVSASFELRLPGHVIDVAGQDLGPAAFDSQAEFEAAPAVTTYRYDADRTFPLLVRRTDGLADSVTYSQRCVTKSEYDDATEAEVKVEDCAVVFEEEGVDDVIQLHLDQEGVRLLEVTQSHADLNPALDDKGELAGTVHMRVATAQAEYQDNIADNETSIPVVFMAPEPAAPAKADDLDNAGVTEVPTGWGDSGPYPYVTLSNKQEQTYGNDWFGASFRFSTNSSYNKHHDAVTAHYKRADAEVRALFLKQSLTLLGGGGGIDWGADRLWNSYKADARITVFGFNLVNMQFNPSFCSTSDGITACPLFEEQVEEVTKNDPSGKGKTRKLQYFKGQEYEQRFQAGPVPLIIIAEVGASLGMGVYGHFIIDQRSSLLNKYGVQFAMGPTAELSTTVFGGVSIGVARAGVEGSLSIVKVSFLPFLRPLAGVSFDSGKNCFKAAEASLEFEGPLTISGPSGEIGIAAYAGVRIRIFGRTFSREKKVFSFTIASFSTWEKTWNAWALATAWKKRPGDAGMCADAIQPTPAESWRSPTSCSNGYCASSSSNSPGSGGHSPDRVLAAYKKTFSLANSTSTCVDVSVVGTTRESLDRLVIYSGNGAPQNSETVYRRFGPYKFPVGSMWGWSGSINQKIRLCSSTVTAALESSANAGGQPGVTVTFTPVN
jgi:hypothetical protein